MMHWTIWKTITAWSLRGTRRWITKRTKLSNTLRWIRNFCFCRSFFSTPLFGCYIFCRFDLAWNFYSGFLFLNGRINCKFWKKELKFRITDAEHILNDLKIRYETEHRRNIENSLPFKFKSWENFSFSIKFEWIEILSPIAIGFFFRWSSHFENSTNFFALNAALTH